MIGRGALYNVLKHAGATCVDTVLKTYSGRLVLLVTDNGRGFAPTMARAGHFGAHSMHERAKSVGGTFAMASAEGYGAQVRVCVPHE
jgi:signal transduction histidine kinase